MKGKEKNDLERFKEYPQQITPPLGLDAPAARLTEELYGKKAAEKKGAAGAAGQAPPSPFAGDPPGIAHSALYRAAYHDDVRRRGGELLFGE